MIGDEGFPPAASRKAITAVIQTLKAEPPPRRRTWDEELVREIAMDIAKSTVFHIGTMYPAAIEATPSTFGLSVRNHIYNEIIAAIATQDADAIAARLKRRRDERRKTAKYYRRGAK